MKQKKAIEIIDEWFKCHYCDFPLRMEGKTIKRKYRKIIARLLLEKLDKRIKCDWCGSREAPFIKLNEGMYGKNKFLCKNCQKQLERLS